MLGAAAAVAAVVALAVGSGPRSSRATSTTRASRSSGNGRRRQFSPTPDARTVALEAGEGRLVVDDDGRAVLVLDGLDPAPQGKTYELWIIEGENASPAGLFPGQDGRDWVGSRRHRRAR